MIRVVAIVLAYAALTASVESTSAQQSLANAGTLTCTLDPGTKEPFGVERQLYCSFDPVVGPKANFAGAVKRLAAKSPGQAKIVLVWSVRAPSTEIPLKQLEGRYVGKLGPAAPDQAPVLIGGKSGKISLQALTIDPKLGANAAVSVLELELKAMKA
jgi:hypothetical protein